MTAAALIRLPIKPVGQPGHGIRFKGQRGNAETTAPPASPARKHIPDTDDHLRAANWRSKAKAVAACPAADATSVCSLVSQADVVQLADVDQFKGIAGLRNQPRFHAPRRADETNLRA